ncbi:helix-turn-helix transcriptional regulator [Pseudonocardia lacus]|uniref:helix-turn-helix transcriptional regulator n=1 Tax=Pseudonocardia lacus TaxID=2835865 RepID=UPI001BDBB385|nr:helix-turn-helix transcriptional regulator [Pseudonocardia lacus]
MTAGAAGRARVEAEWLELVADVMADPLGELPVARLALQLARTFDGLACGFSTAAVDGTVSGEIYPLTEQLGGHRAEVVEWGTRHATRSHPILVHYRATGRPRITQVADVPSAHVGRRLLAAWYAMAGEWGCADQLAFPLPGDPAGTQAFVVGRDRPFSEREIEVAHPLGRLLGGLDRQVRALAGRVPEPAVAAASRMTPRELSVLALLADGLTAAAIARRLAIGERTVHKHLEHVYAKLRVTDRLSAVVRAQHQGLIPAGGAPRAAMSA